MFTLGNSEAKKEEGGGGVIALAQFPKINYTAAHYSPSPARRLSFNTIINHTRSNRANIAMFLTATRNANCETFVQSTS